jgi:pilus assembly protein CpaB
MSLRTLASLAVAIFLGLIAVLLVRGVLVSQRPNAPVQTTAMTPVVVAVAPIERGVELKPAMLRTVDYPTAAVPQGSFQKVEQLTGQTTTRTTLRSVAANEPVLASKLSGAGGKTNLSGTLTPGMRAVSVRSNDVLGVGGYALPGDRVDVLLTRKVGKGDAETTLTQVLAENSLVLGVDQMSDPEADKPQVSKAVTLEVTPDQAQIISLALSIGDVSLSLRPLADGAVLDRKVTRVADLGGFGAPRAAAPKRAAPGPARAGLTEVKVTRGVVTSGYPVGSF